MLEGEGEKGWKDTKWGLCRFLLRLVSLLSPIARDRTRDEGKSNVGVERHPNGEVYKAS